MFKLFSRKKKEVAEQGKKTFNKNFIIGMATLATTSALAVPCFAAEGGIVDSGVTTAVSVFGQVWTLITGNPVLIAFVGASLLGVGVGVFKKLKGSVK